MLATIYLKGDITATTSINLHKLQQTENMAFS